ncbi:MAG: hypothetical protein ACM3PW_10350 [Chlamydiota bacterium]
MKGRKRSRIVLIRTGQTPAPPLNGKVIPKPQDISSAQEEEQFLQKFLKLADIALKPAPAKPKKIA